MSKAIPGYGTVIQLGDNSSSPTQFDDIAEVLKITPPGEDVEAIDVTHLSSPNATKEFLAGLITPGEVNFEMNFVPTKDSPDGLSIDDLRTVERARAPRTFKIVLPDGSPATECTFTGFVKSINQEVPLDSQITATVSIQVTGQPEWT